jgi:ferrous iron transport protein B
MGWIEDGFAWLGGAVSGLWPAGSESWLRSLLVDGIIGGVGGVVVFLPNIVLLFACLSVIEDTGYMARVAFLMDRLMHSFGLHGRSFIPMMLGFGCSIPAIMATRTLEDERDRLATMMVLPLMSCGARLTIWMLLVPAFFSPEWRAPVLWGIYMGGMVLALLLALLLKRTVLRGQEAPFMMELPPYRLPTLRAAATRMQQRSWIYLRKAGTVILGISIVLWALTTYPRLSDEELERRLAGGQTQSMMLAAVGPATAPPARLGGEALQNRRTAERLKHSVAGHIGQALEPLLAPLGFDWKISTAMLGAFAAKEVFVAQMGIVYSMGEADEESEGLRQALQRDYSPLTAVSLIIFLLIATPCMATLAITRRESGSWRWAALQVGGLTAVAYLLALVVYQTGRLLAG